MTKRIAVVGAGGRTGTLFAHELRNSAEIVGVARHPQAEDIREGRILVERQGSMPERLACDVIEDDAFTAEVAPDFLFLATKNPVAPSVRHYYKQGQQEKPPDLILSQNGVVAAEEARTELEGIFGVRADAIRILRVSLLNPVSVRTADDKTVIAYFAPVCLAFGVASGPDETQDLLELFLGAGIEAEAVASCDVKNMEFSKLFTNLLGVPSAAHGLTIEEGFADRAVFEEEIRALREYAQVVKRSEGRLLNLRHFPTGLYATLLGTVPIPILSLFRKQIATVITKGRGSKEKGNIDEIDYYSGAVVSMGERLGVETPVNRKICQTMKARTR
jgi:ketopantoate reductase